MQHLKSLLFALGALTWTSVLAVLYLPLLLASRRSVHRGAKFWVKGVIAWLASTVGLGHEIRGQDNIPEGPVVFASKHQSAWDTIIFNHLFEEPAFILKRGLFWVPFFGWYLNKAGMIGIDRQAGASALKTMLREAGKALEGGRPVIIFPEGTRTAPGARRSYHPGVAALYRQLDAAVVPIALNSGVFWGRRAFLKRPGTIVLEFLPAIEPGLSRTDFQSRLEDAVETASARLAEEARASAD